MGSFYMLYRYTKQLDAFRIFARRMVTLPKLEDVWSYDESVTLLNSLQSNAKAVQMIRERIRRREDCVNLTETWKYLNRIGVNKDDLRKLSVIHIAGTKGKGTTSAICESILRQHGYKTALYTSPHLVSVTERIQIGGKKLTKDSFANNFTRVFRSLNSKQEHDGDMPGYFMFLTILALDVFLRENVDVAVVEVGIGGEYDITNVVNNVTTVGISSLGLEHTAILGNTIEQIAREKGGIMKTGCIAFTVDQPPSALNVLRNIALTRNCILNIVPNFESYSWDSGAAPTLTADVPVYKLNASLAIQLAHTWMNNHTDITANSSNIFTNLKQFSQLKTDSTSNNEVLIKNTCNNLELIEMFVNQDKCIKNIPSKTSEAISKCVWPGRCQVYNDSLIDYYIDGAHTLESIEVCIEWFKRQIRLSSKKILIFNVTGDREAEPILSKIARIGFDVAIFTPNVAYRNKQCVDQINYSSCKDVTAACENNLEIWKTLHKDTSPEMIATTMNCVEDGVEHVEKCYGGSTEKPQVLVTGSLHLVGALLAVLTAS